MFYKDSLVNREFTWYDLSCSLQHFGDLSQRVLAMLCSGTWLDRRGRPPVMVNTASISSFFLFVLKYLQWCDLNILIVVSILSKNQNDAYYAGVLTRVNRIFRSQEASSSLTYLVSVCVIDELSYVRKNIKYVSFSSVGLKHQNLFL